MAEAKVISTRSDANPRSRPWVPSLFFLLSWAPVFLFIVAALGLWELSVRLAGVARWLLPPPSAIFDELYQSRVLLWDHTLVTLQEVVVGLAVALGAGTILAASMAFSRLLHRGLYPFVIASQTVPIVAIAPLLLIWVGYGLTAKVIVVALISFFPIVVNMIDGIKSVDVDMVDMMRSFGASKWQVFTKLQVPSSLPYLFSGVKIAASVSVIGAVIGEWVGSSRGLGYLMTRSIPQFQTDRVFAAIFILAFLGVALFILAVLAERLALPWRRATSNMES